MIAKTKCDKFSGGEGLGVVFRISPKVDACGAGGATFSTNIHQK